jgi:hypothetical protein
MALPPCGFYQTRLALGSIGIGQLVYFHNHGDPGPGIYLPLSWQHNRVQWNTAGHTIPDEAFAASLKWLEPEGLFVVKTAFYCCEKKCQHFHPNQLVQVGYNGEAQGIIFVPELSAQGLSFPQAGTVIESAAFTHLSRVTVAAGQAPKQQTEFLH